ncbi:MAG: phenylalanine--tRNA ligase subunit beta, partial [Defluviitaleaceae bacterium]|nr:phenylalanine--tRNA ligase subunit beta [Defluviitaleaceae bacterium]
MKIPVSWLEEHIGKIEDLHEFCEAMTMSGSKVEKVHLVGHEITGVVTGRVMEILPHPDADKLVVTRVDVGESEPKQIVTGATNLKVGDYIPVALHGASLADGLKIKKG